MSGADALVARIEAAFAGTVHPGDAFLAGSSEGSEPGESVAPFVGRHDWRELDGDFLDANYTALSFLSEGGFRFYLPAWMVADLRGRLETADPFFHLTGGFSTLETPIDAGGTRVVRRSGGRVPLNPRRYGAMTFEDHARQRLSVFTREEAGAIVAYLEHRRDADEFDRDRATAALEAFWLERARSAPTADDLARHLRAEEEFVAAIRRRYGG